MLVDNKILKNLTIGIVNNKKISIQISKKIIESLKINNTLRKFIFDGLDIEPIEKNILEMLETNYSLENICNCDKFSHLMTPETRMSRMRFTKTKSAAQK